MEHTEATACPNCGHIHADEFCSVCGQRRLPRFTWNYLWNSILETLEFERGMLRTFRDMVVRPAAMMQQFWSGGTQGYTNPFKYILLAVAISATIVQLFGQDVFNQLNEQLKPATKDALDKELLQTMVAVLRNETFEKALNLYTLPFLSFGSWLIFKKNGRNYTEHLLAWCFIQATTVLLTVPLQGLSLAISQMPQPYPGLASMGSALVSFGYGFRTSGKVFGHPKPGKGKYLRAVAAYLLGMTITYITVGIATLIWLLTSGLVKF